MMMPALQDSYKQRTEVLSQCSMVGAILTGPDHPALGYHVTTAHFLLIDGTHTLL